jgi:hypothetical protein
MANAREWSAVVAYVLGFSGSERFAGLLSAVPPESVELELPQTGQEINRFFSEEVSSESERSLNSSVMAEYSSLVTNSCNSLTGSDCASFKLWFIFRMRSSLGRRIRKVSPAYAPWPSVPGFLGA